ncbi:MULTISPECIES: hypothetical protein [unclassified Clostridium]|uniref:hypothetical protein n=1 Tax=unclassified Clostridium TaxID=2614128 RepID=UPI00029748FE|nr:MULTISPECIES: hypothetical protein [unclassified Clostridium]EKQ56667.1 MAG: hypothetical protein A370_01742 [Clostridium sp. Maddingley MBC34-26]
MEYIEKNSNFKMSIESFSKIISERWNADGDIIKNYIFSNISLCLSRNSQAKNDLERLYMADKLKYYNAFLNSSSLNYVLIMQATIEEQIWARKILGILLVAESDNNIRNKVIKLLKKYYPLVYESVKKRNKEKLKNKYIKMDIISRNIEARFDAAIYFYFATYISSEVVDQGFIISILNDIEEFEFSDLINRDFEEEIEKYKDEVQEIKLLLKMEYGKVFNIKDIFRHNNEKVRNCGEFLEDLFLSNKLNINYIFHDLDFINVDKIILSYVRVSKDKNLELLIQNIISGLFVQVLINEYKKMRDMYFKSSGEVLHYELNTLVEKLKIIEHENVNLKANIESLNKEKSLFDKNLNRELNKLENSHKQQMKIMEDKIKSLEKKLSEEMSIRSELESLREYELNLNEFENNYDLTRNLGDYINNKKVIIIGGDKEWRRRFRVKYPEIRTLNGFNENFDASVLNNSDYIFFYSKYMNHSTFHKAMNFIKFNKCNFGYIGKTNIELVEQEIIENISKYEEYVTKQ